MLISYPVLPGGAHNDDEDAYLNDILDTYALDREGRYPVTSLPTPTGPMHRWHGGIHMQGQGQPLRAIADGTVIAYRFAPTSEIYEGMGNYDTSFVLIKHETETGENTPVVFYSLYMHLANRQDLLPDRYSQLPAWMKQAGPNATVRRPNQKIWRKEVLGFAGKLYDRETCHFEVFATDEAFAAFWRDSLFKAEGCGSDGWFGDAHFVIPQGRQFLARHPRATDQGPHRIEFDARTRYDLPLGQDGRNESGGAIDQTLYASVRLHEGTRIATTYTWDKASGSYVKLGASVQQPDYEYELYRLATALYPDCPSAGYEWLRFGRVLGPDRTTRNENWQLIRYAGDKIGYIDLAPNEILKLSDADFPHWQGWEKHSHGKLVDGDNGLCTDESIIDLMQGTDNESRKKLRHLICQHPSEWDASDLATRYATLRQPGQWLHEDESWSLFEQHVQKLAFWAEAGLPQRSVWHFHPLQFIRHMRKCGWRSQSEILQLVPAHIIRKPGSHNSASQGHWEAPSLAAANTLLSACLLELNRALRKYCIDTPIRQACFFGNAVQETGWFRGLVEANGSQPALHQGWYGRGFLQLTNPGGAINGGNNNYYKYFRFVGRTPHVPPGTQEIAWRNEIGSVPHRAADSAGAYWVWPNKCAPTTQRPDLPQVDSANKYADEPAQNQRRTIGISGGGSKVWYYNQSFSNCAAAVNYPATVHDNPPNMNGLVDRSTAFVNALMVLTDNPLFPDAQGGNQNVPENFSRRTVL